MNTLEKLHEVRDILQSIMAASRTAYPATLCRAHRILELAIDDFFQSEDDVAVAFPDDEIVGELIRSEVPF
jgi:hypothetical protein